MLPRRAPRDIAWPRGSRTDRMCPHPSKPNSFVVAIRDRDRFKEAIRTKLVLEVAGGTPERRIVPVTEKSRGCPVSLVREYGRTAASGERRHHP